ncbi:MAG: hypothetical protein IPQ03_12465 [Bacteroidetes bacterium]|nr:hypothetical protein [Bacteroidota bacterium]
MKKLFISILFLLQYFLVIGQSPENFQLVIEEDTISGMPGLQSFVHAQVDGKWLLIGGRTDGLHQRQPFASFAVAGNNTNIYVVDPEQKQVWTGSLNGLPTGLVEQLQSTNMEFIQHDDKLYIIGGYGYSATAADHITFPNLTVVDVPKVVQAIMNGTSIASYFKQVTDQRMAVTGGYLGRLATTFTSCADNDSMGVTIRWEWLPMCRCTRMKSGNFLFWKVEEH